MPPPAPRAREWVAARTCRHAEPSEGELNKTVQFPVAPGKMGDVRKADVLWMTMQDQIHHRGQFSVYLRLAGAKVPSICGPTADETWM